MTINRKELVTMMQLENGATIVNASYLDDLDEKESNDLVTLEPATRVYSFKNVTGIDLAPGDLVICETRHFMGSNSIGFKILKVVDPDVSPTEIGCDLDRLVHVVCKVKNDEYLAAKAAEGRAMHRLARAEVTSKLDEYRASIGDATFTAVARLTKLDEDETQVIEE